MLPIALIDACVLYPAPLRDLLMHLALADLYLARWTEAIHDEWTRAVLENRPDIPPSQLQRTRELMNAHVRDCLVTGYEDLIASLALPDADDRHVLAAAIVAGADRILTFNRKDFPASALAPHGIAVQDPDWFVVELLAAQPVRLCAAMQRHRSTLKKPPKTVEEYLDGLQRCGLSRTVAALFPFGAAL